MVPLAAADEGRHSPEDGDPRWEESWDFDFTTSGGDLGGYLRLGLHPAAGVTWFWAALVGEGRPLVTVVDHDVALPRGPGLDLRAEGLWADAVCETPLEHWTLGLEAFGVALDDPSEAYRSVRGDRTALGFDMEWETAGPASERRPAGYHLPCAVHGQVLVGREVIDFDGWGGRSHEWGERDWTRPWCTSTGRLDDASTWHVHLEEPGAAAGPGDGGLARPGRLPAGPTGDLSVRPLHQAPVHVVGSGGRTSRLARALCLYAVPDGRRGTGWTEWNAPTQP